MTLPATSMNDKYNKKQIKKTMKIDQNIFWEW